MKYVNLFFVQGEDALPWLDDLDNFGAESIFAEMLYNASEAEEDDTQDRTPWGESDGMRAIWRNGSAYVISFSFKISYIALTRIEGVYVERGSNNVLGQFVRIHARPEIGEQLYEGYTESEALERFLFIHA